MPDPAVGAEPHPMFDDVHLLSSVLSWGGVEEVIGSDLHARAIEALRRLDAVVADRDALQRDKDVAITEALYRGGELEKLRRDRDALQERADHYERTLKWIGTAYESPPQQTVASIAAFARAALGESAGESKP